jgi:hypothetical protein
MSPNGRRDLGAGVPGAFPDPRPFFLAFVQFILNDSRRP